MSAITGCLALQPGAQPDERWVRAATSGLAHRGGDGEGFHADADIALGVSRLAIIDPTEGAQQPVCSANGRFWMVYNGEIYNHLELAASLRARGIDLRTGSDAEALLEAYALLGRDVVRKLRGMYAFAIWDTWKRQLFCARDPFGLKPFYYARDDRGGLLRFASERKALAVPGAPAPLDPDALSRYLAFQYVPAPRTIAGRVRVLPPGHTLTARPGGSVRVARYWRAELRPVRGGERGRAAGILSALRDSVAVHLRSDAPLGAFLSGGIDSAGICALAAEHRPDLLTFTVGFERAGYSEIGRAQEAAAALGVKSLPYVITAGEFFAALPQIIWHLDDPMADAAAVPLWFVAREASKHVKVVLSGEGADELFGGYQGYHQASPVRACQGLPAWARAPLHRLAALIPPGVKGRGLLERASTPLRRQYIGNAHVYVDGQADAIAGPGLAGPGAPGRPYPVTRPLFAQASGAGLDDVATMQLVDINTWLAGDILVKADRMTMAHSLELRVPFLDREVMAVAARLSREDKTGAGTTKLALRQALRDVLPPAVAQRPKLGFPVPIGQWLRGEAREFAERLLREAQTGEWIDQAAALTLLRRCQAGRPGVSWRQVWVLIVFSLWHQIYVEGAYDPAALGWERPGGAAQQAAARGSRA
jgi:asparagine synthase (glutamine-hydrolysing)